MSVTFTINLVAYFLLIEGLIIKVIQETRGTQTSYFLLEAEPN